MAARLGPIIGSVVFFGIAPGIVTGWVPYILSRWKMEPPFLGYVTFRWIGSTLVVIGIAGLVDSFARFALVGGGTPAPVAPTETLVVSGLYRYVRNPMYVAVVATILGQALLFARGSLLTYAAVVWGLFHLFVLAYEEPTLLRRFGNSYRVYQKGVRRWWPRLTAWDPARHGPEAA